MGLSLGLLLLDDEGLARGRLTFWLPGRSIDL
jgi:hypothetical protein